MRIEHVDLILAWAKLVNALREDGYRGHLMSSFRFMLEEPLEVDRNTDHRVLYDHTQMSVAAADMWQRVRPESGAENYRSKQLAGLCGDHVIPLSITAKEVLQHANHPDEIVRIAHEGLLICFITKDEDRMLSAAGLRNRMPESWKPGDNPWARYDAVGIDVASRSPVPAMRYSGLGR